jgi:hypothetical protein
MDFLQYFLLAFSVSMIVSIVVVFCYILIYIFVPVPDSTNVLLKIGYLLLGFFAPLVCSSGLHIADVEYNLRNPREHKENTIKKLIKLGLSREEFEDLERSANMRKALRRDEDY